ncbi:proteasome protein [Halapricum sp. CBA1109]|uniref:Mov34/MPN/PAD-1 family protein n=1 Tax=Halapricum sp. CBA1109 TaxID=2668068 RepID=UPI0012F95184|nr:Mov34/MPN/PAD-1 family protein [Halapricum sp. CBA1109]MUV88707.1 proteasome protein [Halapricum sp. CBA1109]
MRLFRNSEIIGIAESALTFALESSRDSHPNEYMGLLRGEDARKLGLDRSGTVLSDVLVIPGTESNPVSATVKTSMVPNDVSAAGSIHSHPNGVLKPSDADLATFGKGDVHIIVGAPYERGDWQAFDTEGDPIDLPVLDVELPEKEFFDFTQADIDRELAPSEEDDRDGGWFF